LDDSHSLFLAKWILPIPHLSYPQAFGGYPSERGKERFLLGAVEKSRQRRSRQFSVLTYWKYALREKLTAALLDELF